MASDRPRHLRPADQLDLTRQLVQELPEPWRGPVIGPGLPGWETPPGEDEKKIILTGLPDPFPAELAWMAHWQEVIDGTPATVQPINQLALVLRHAQRHHHPFPASIRDMDPDTADRLLGWYYATRWRRLPPNHTRGRLRAVFRVARLALIARCHDGHWWELDEWYPRCDPRIPVSAREPRNSRLTPGRIRHPWLRAAVKWHLGTQLEAGTLRWSTLGQARQLIRLDRWLSVAFTNPLDVLGDPAAAAAQAAAFGRWASDPVNRAVRPHDRPSVVAPRQVNDDLRAVAELFDFVAANSDEARVVLGDSPWARVTETHAASWRRQVSRIPRQSTLNDQHYVDDHALAQIIVALPLLGLPRDQEMTITRGDGTTVLANGIGDPQAMRMILLQILTGRRASEIRTCEFDCLSPIPDPPVGSTDGAEVVQFRYAQSKIDIAPDTILVDREVSAVIEEQQEWLRARFPNSTPRYLFSQRFCNLALTKPYPAGSYRRWLHQFSELVAITDSKGRPVRLTHTHRFRHTRLTRLAELGLPITVLQRYAGHATPMMSMHYVAQREQHAEQAFLATANCAPTAPS